ncbi:MFS transporter [Achromobacter arsenitoxydans]|uniref:Major facilitator superfamily transporter n=1 Tax=Achromobacter arsenitoxydans SY8 TaxID=477184 RepID=H0FE22_9BURK|nr:MFS transporter [Achromobacter arsenitoxydans]EHK63468.1 major facilitator superfamily transporter [Achromobacter arsenitoxydans SY8]
MSALAGATLLASLGVSIVTVALPALARAFSAPVSSVQGVVLAYLVSVTVTITLAGKLGDLIGHRRALMGGLMLFTLASLSCAVAPTLGVLIAGRAIQGLGGAMLLALPLSIAREVVAKERLGSAMGLIGTVSALGTALGPSLGGMLIGELGWRAAFVMLAVLSASTWGLAAWAIPSAAPRPIASAKSLDWLGAATLTTTLVLYALATLGGKSGFAMDARLLLALAVVALGIFIYVESRAPSPLVPMALLRDSMTRASLAMNLLVSTVMMSTLVVGPFFLAYGLGLGEAETGLVMAAGPLVAAFSGIPAGRMTDRFGAQKTLVFGLVQTTAGLVCLAYAPRALGVAGYVLALMVLTPGFQLFLAANNTAVMSGAEESQRGMLSGLLGLSRNLGFMTGASVMSGLFAHFIGAHGLGGASSDEVAMAFTMTFLGAVGLGVMAMLLALSKLGKREESYL